MALTAQEVSTAVTEVESVGDEILVVIEAVEPGVALPAELAGKVLDLAASAVQKYLATISGISGKPITPEMIQGLMVTTDPLPDADAKA